MSTSSSDTSQRIPWQLRADLQIVPLQFGGRATWSVKDPVTLDYYELREEEYFVVQQLSGTSSLNEICTAFHRQYRPKTLSTDELQQFVGRLIGQGLMVADGPGYGRVLVLRQEQAQSTRRWSRLGNVLCIRFRGLDPDRLLGWLLARMGWLFSPLALGAGLLLICCALVLVTVQFDRVLERLPDTRALLSPPNLIWLPMLLAVVKILHELGHGLACKRFGGECRELGMMLLVFTPTLYCNVSDMWMVRNKWKRIAVSAAGMWVEAVIAAMCTLLWWFSTPGLFHSLCLNLMFICGVSTILFNGNPLLRYDGYFVLSDWLEIPNLQQQATGMIRNWVSGWFCGIVDPSVANESPSHRWLLAGYGVASVCYRAMLTFLILWSLYFWLEPYGLAVLVQLMAIPLIGLMILNPIMASIGFLRASENRDRIDWRRLGFRLVLAAMIVGLVLTIPIPSRVKAVALLDQDAAQRVYATLGGTLEWGIRLGETVTAGQEIARLVDPKMQTELIRLEGEYNQNRLRLEQLERERIRDPQVATLIPSIREAMRDFESQLSQLRETANRLTLRSPCEGQILPPARQPGLVARGALPIWSGSPLEPQNQGCFVKSGTTVCLVGPAESRVAVVLVNQDDINLVRIGQNVRLVWRELAGEVLAGHVTEIAGLDLDLLPHDAVQRLSLPARTNAEGALVPVGTWYQVRVSLYATDAPLIRGAAGEAKILVDPQSLGQRLLRWATRTFAA